MFVVDSSVLATAADRGDPGHEMCRSQLETWRQQPTPWYLTWPILFDFLRIVSDPNVYRKPWTIEQAWNFVDAILASPNLTVLTAGDRHQSIVEILLGDIPGLRGESMHEMQVVATMLEHGIKQIVTRDTEFYRFSMLEVRDPLQTKS